MGNSNQNFTLAYFPDDYILFLNNSPNPRYGNVQPYKHKQTNEFVCIKCMLFKNQQDYGELYDYISQIQPSEYQDLFIKFYGIKKENQLFVNCGEHYNAYLLYQYYPLNLQQVIIQNKQKSIPLSESHIWYILYHLVAQSIALNQMQKQHQDINPSNVLIDSNFSIKFAPVGTFPNDTNSYHKFIQNDERNYMAPELLDRKMWGQSINWNHADMYASGRTLLDAMSLKLSPKFYNYHERIAFLNKQFTKVGSYGYSSPLCQIVGYMIEENQYSRATFAQLNQILLQYRQQILQKQSFDFQVNIAQFIQQNNAEKDRQFIEELMTARQNGYQNKEVNNGKIQGSSYLNKTSYTTYQNLILNNRLSVKGNNSPKQRKSVQKHEYNVISSQKGLETQQSNYKQNIVTQVSQVKNSQVNNQDFSSQQSPIQQQPMIFTFQQQNNQQQQNNLRGLSIQQNPNIQYINPIANQLGYQNQNNQDFIGSNQINQNQVRSNQNNQNYLSQNQNSASQYQNKQAIVSQYQNNQNIINQYQQNQNIIGQNSIVRKTSNLQNNTLLKHQYEPIKSPNLLSPINKEPSESVRDGSTSSHYMKKVSEKINQVVNHTKQLKQTNN